MANNKLVWVNTRMPKTLRNILDEIAEEKELNRSAAIRWLIKKEDKQRKTEQATQEAAQ